MTNLKTTDCTGCGCCANICPKNAIKIIQDKEGFYKPEINFELCINCTLCEKNCPQINQSCGNTKNPDCYAAMAPDEIRKISSSGGAFTLIAKYILDKGGAVCGAAFDENWTVKHIIVDNYNDLDKLRGSKYIQSFISETLFKEIKEYLDFGRYFLFVGTPCQVAGLVNFLGKEYDKLVTVDLICAYVPSAKVFEKYLSENYQKENLAKYNFRDKEISGWSCSNTTILTKSMNKKVDYKYLSPYLNRMFKGEQCVNCRYKSFPRPGDFTIGDYWKIHEHTPKMDDKKGTSGVLLNNPKAEKIFNEIKDGFYKLKKMPLDTLGWQIDVKHKIPKTAACKYFYNHFGEKSFVELVQDASKKTKVATINWWFINNRGAILTNYALNEMIKECGLEPYTINYITPFERLNFETKGYVKDFTNKYIRRTKWCENKNELKKLNEEIGTFIAGSDQIFRFFPANAHDNIFYLNWVDAKYNKLLSYSASFAVNTFSASTAQTNLVKHWLKRFDAHSIREFDGVDIMANTFNLPSVQVMDPVFCIDKQKYVEIGNKAKNKTKGDFVAYYLMFPTKEKKKAVKYIKKQLNIKQEIFLNKLEISMEEWLWYIQNAKFIITDSFHGTCFSIIFNKQFCVLPNTKEYASRFLTISEITGLKSRFFYDYNDLYTSSDLFYPIDWSECNKQISINVEKSKKWLKDNLEALHVYNLNEQEEMYDAIIDRLEEDLVKVNNIIIQGDKRIENEFWCATNYNKNRLKYLKYRFLKNIVFGKTKIRYKEKSKIYKEKVRTARIVRKRNK